jgi:hypothetical protein
MPRVDGQPHPRTYTAKPGGRIRIHTESVQGFGLPVNGLLELFGLEVDSLLKVEPGHGVTVDGNDLLLDPAMLLPPPAMNGKITAVRIEGNALVQTSIAGKANSSPATRRPRQAAGSRPTCRTTTTCRAAPPAQIIPAAASRASLRQAIAGQCPADHVIDLACEERHATPRPLASASRRIGYATSRSFTPVPPGSCRSSPQAARC